MFNFIEGVIKISMEYFFHLIFLFRHTSKNKIYISSVNLQLKDPKQIHVVWQIELWHKTVK